jgi:hypothetical protein
MDNSVVVEVVFEGVHGALGTKEVETPQSNESNVAVNGSRVIVMI